MVSKDSFVSLNSMIEFGKCQALNTEGNFSVKETFGCGGALKSNEGDPEMMFLITFKEKLSMTGVMVEALDSDKAPKTLKLYAGKNNIDFSDLDNLKPTEEIKLESGKVHSLKLAKYRNIDSVALFMTNEEAQSIKVNNIQLFGTGGENVDFSQVKNVNP